MNIFEFSLFQKHVHVNTPAVISFVFNVRSIDITTIAQTKEEKRGERMEARKVGGKEERMRNERINMKYSFVLYEVDKGQNMIIVTMVSDSNVIVHEDKRYLFIANKYIIIKIILRKHVYQ